MAHHEETIIAVQNGEMRMQKEEGGEWTYAVLGKGFCMAANNRVTVLADTVERPEEVDVNRAKEALERAQERLRQKQSIQEYHTTQAALARALTRLKETEKFVEIDCLVEQLTIREGRVGGIPLFQRPASLVLKYFYHCLYEIYIILLC